MGVSDRYIYAKISLTCRIILVIILVGSSPTSTIYVGSAVRQLSLLSCSGEGERFQCTFRARLVMTIA
jgi:hypothetical protein